MKELEQYVAFRRLKNFACVKLLKKELQIWTRLDPSSVALEEGFTRDVSQLGHAGTGDLEIRLHRVWMRSALETQWQFRSHVHRSGGVVAGLANRNSLDGREGNNRFVVAGGPF